LRSEGEGSHDSDIIPVPDVAAAAEYLKDTKGNVLVATGSKELAKFTEIEGYRDRIFARVLSLPSVAEACAKLGFEGRNIVCMQGPFCEELNYGMLKQVDAAYMVTKDSGSPGGFEEKLRAARRAGTKTILVGRPKCDEGLSYSQVLKYLEEKTDVRLYSGQDAVLPGKRKVTLAGIGMGARGGMTLEVAEACRTADLLVGAERMLRSADPGGKDTLVEYRAPRILEFISAHPEYSNIVVLLSGDVGFYSAAAPILDGIDRSSFDVELKCGISSVSYLCSKLSIPWQDVFLLSAHGRDANIPGEVRRHEKVFALLSRDYGVREMCSQLEEYGMAEATVTIGQDLSGVEERIVTGRADEIKDLEFRGLCVALIQNSRYDGTCPIGISDGDFVKGDAPMTKSEVRSLAVTKLRLSQDSIVYDIGAGVGSVSVEAARVAVRGKVFAIEQEEKLVSLVELNKRNLVAPNIVVVEGSAPEAMKDLPDPTHAFIGGSSGNVGEIISALLEKNPKIRLVINAVTLETVADTMDCIKRLGLVEEETISVSISKSRTVGRYHLMTGQNPIYIIVCRGSALA
jgi:precorrin-6Y C5,15-methyltransferase (decarboxylating)